MKTSTPFSSFEGSEILPELPEVETVRRGLEQAMLGRTITNVLLRRENLRFPFPDDFPSRVIGRTIDSIRRRAKYLLLDLNDGQTILSHLGMSGRYTLFDSEKVKQFPAGDDEVSRFGSATGFEGRHDHVEFRFDDESVAVYTDPRRFGIMDLIEVGEEQIHPLLESLGPEPFGDWSAKDLAKNCRAKQPASKLHYSTNVLLLVSVTSTHAKHCIVVESILNDRVRRWFEKMENRPKNCNACMKTSFKFSSKRLKLVAVH